MQYFQTIVFIWACFFTCSGSWERWLLCSFCVCLCYTLGGCFTKKKRNNYCLLGVRKSLSHLLLERENWKLLNYSLTRHGFKKMQVGWLCGTLESCSKLFLGHDKWNILFTNHFQKLYPPLSMHYRTFSEWFLIAFL